MALMIDLTPETESRLIEAPLSPEDRAARVAAARGKYAHVLTSADEFSRRKQEEIDLEDRRSRERSA